MPWPLYPLEGRGTHCTGGWVGPRHVNLVPFFIIQVASHLTKHNLVAEFLPKLLWVVYITLRAKHMYMIRVLHHMTIPTVGDFPITDDFFRVQLSINTAIPQACAHIHFGGLLTESTDRGSSTTVWFSRSATPFHSGTYIADSNKVISQSLKTRRTSSHVNSLPPSHRNIFYL